jgi:hypothetical protein
MLTFVRRMINQQGYLGEMTGLELPLRIVANQNTINDWAVIKVSVCISTVFVTCLVSGLCGVPKTFVGKASKACKVRAI